MRISLCRLAAIVGLVLTAVLSVAFAVRPPEPDPVPQRWQLDLEIGPMRLAIVDVPDVGPQPFLYMTYQVTNNSGRDLQFAPVFDLATEGGDVLRAGVGVPRAARESLLGLLDDPLLEDQISIIGVLLQGRENAKDGLVIWPAQELQSDEFVVYAGGFSGETQQVAFTDPETGEPVTLTFRKTYMVRYDTPGSLLGRGSMPLEVATERWIMR